MIELLLQTKLHIPTLPSGPEERLRARFISRPRLMKQLNEGLTGKLTLISAPAGFGKTTLVSEWLGQMARPAAWLTLDEDDNDFRRFFTYFAAALQTIQPDVGASVLDLLQSSPLPHSHALLTPLINDLTAIPENFILILDDYHMIETEAIDQGLSFFIDHMPPHMHLVMISRADPNLSLSRLRANQQLNEFRSADLRFTQAETAQFLEQMAGLSLSAEEVARLDRRTEGWIAGLQMATLSLRQRQGAEVAQFIEDFSGSHRYIMDYLMDEVLQQQPAEVQTFLLFTSILDRLCAPLCEAVISGNTAQVGSVPGNSFLPAVIDASQAQAQLAYVEHANLFIQPLDDLASAAGGASAHTWYRYHPLFADLLRHRLNQLYPHLVPSLHLCASQWYEQAGETGPAVQHALAAQAFDRAAGLLEKAAPAMIQRSELARLLKWLDRLPEEAVEPRPLLGLFFGWGLLLIGQTQQTEARLKVVEAQVLKDEEKRTPEVQGHMAAIRAYLAREAGDFQSTVDLSQQALAHLPEQNALLRAMVMLNLAIAYYLQDAFSPALQLLDEIIATGQTAQRMANTLSAIYLKSQILRAQGLLQQALTLCQEGLDLVKRKGWHNFPAVGFLDVAIGDLFYEQNAMVQAAEYLEKGIQLGEAGAHPHILIIGNARLAWLRQTQGDAAGSRAAIHAALVRVQSNPGSRFWPLPSIDYYQTRLWIAQGNLTAASQWVQESGLDLKDTPVTFFNEKEYLAQARLRIAQGKPEAADMILSRLRQVAEPAGRRGSLIEILILQALTFYQQKRNGESMTALDQALGLAEGEGFVRIFLDEGQPMVTLLRQAVAQGLHAPFALRLLYAFGETEAASQPLVEPLSEREQEVLRRMAAGYSNQEIAQELVVAVSTVKKHINNIYGKLGVGSRTQAVARAREFGLL